MGEHTDNENFENDAIVKIYKSDRKLELWENDQLIHAFKIGLGFSPKGDKIREGDGRTPEGEYYICTKNEKSRFTLFLGISYPNIKDAERGFKEGIIDGDTYIKIKQLIEAHKRPDWSTQLGGQIGIHGKGSVFDWTAGCIAMDDEDIKSLWEHVEIGTPVIIYK